MLNRTLAPEIQLPNVLNFPTAEKEVLQNKLPIYVVKGSTEPIVRLLLFFEAGRFFESKQQVSALTVGMINKGTLSRNAFEIAETLEFYGASLRIEANMYVASISLSCLKAQLPYILPVINDMLINATFPENELSQLIERAKQKLKINLKKNEFIASQHFNKALFGENHPFGYLNTKEAIENVTQEDLINHYQQHFSFNKFSFGIIAGDVGLQEIKLLNHYLGSLNYLENSALPETILSPESNKLIEISRPKSVQAAIRAGYTSIGIHHEDYTELGVVNTLLGGYFGSRLMSNIREEKGFTYGIYSFIAPLKDISYLCISTEVGVEYKDATLEEIYREIERLKNEPVGEEELKMVKNYMIGQLMKSVDGPLKMANTLKNLLIFNKSQWEVNKDLATISAITPDKIQELAKKYLNFEDMYKVIAL
jgi:zinc protease